MEEAPVLVVRPCARGRELVLPDDASGALRKVRWEPASAREGGQVGGRATARPTPDRVEAQLCCGVPPLAHRPSRGLRTDEQVNDAEPDAALLLVDDEAEPALDARVGPAVASLVEDAGDGGRQDLAGFWNGRLDLGFVLGLEGRDGGHLGDARWRLRAEARR